MLSGDYDGTIHNNITRVYRNNGNGTFGDIVAGLTGVRESSVDWGDYDNDGDLDILVAGQNGTQELAIVYRNNGNNTFSSLVGGLTGVRGSSLAWGDSDNDGDLDIVLTGWPGSGTSQIARVYRNNDCAPELSLTKSVSSDMLLAGDTLTYTLVFSNAGGNPTAGVTITDIIPNAVTNVTYHTSVDSGVYHHPYRRDNLPMDTK